MIKDHSREKLINAIIFFSKNTWNCGKIKLYKLLYFLDFEHYAEVGRNVTGLSYQAWNHGPVPKALANEIKHPAQDMASKLSFKFNKHGTWETLEIDNLCDFDPNNFTKRELRIMEKLAEEFKISKADEMIEATHLENQPWHQIYEVEKKVYKDIPYDLALKSSEKTEMQSFIRENEEFKQNFK